MTGTLVPARRRSTGARPSDDHLLDAACLVFAHSGYADTTMAAIAGEADTTKPTLYAHFGDKQSLYLRLLDREASTCRDWLADGYERGAGLELAAQVDADMVAFFDYAAQRPHGFALLFAAKPTERSSEIERALRRDVIALVARRIEDFLRVAAGASTSDAFVVDQLASMLVGVAVSAAEAAVSSGHDLTAAGRLASAFCAGALSGLLQSAG